MFFRDCALALLLLPLFSWAGVLPGGRPALGAPGGSTPDVQQLERSWERLDAELRALDALLPAEPQAPVGDLLRTPELPAGLIRANQPATAPLQPEQGVAPPPLALPTADQLAAGSVAALSLEQALAVAFANSAGLQAQREQVAAALAGFQAAMGSDWPTISAFAAGSYTGGSLTTTAKQGNSNLGFGPLFEPGGPFYVPKGGRVAFNSGVAAVEGGLQLSYALLDLSRTPRVRAARAGLEQQRNRYASQLRSLQLQVSEAYYGLQQSEQLVRVYDANLRNDLVVLQESLDLRQAGLVPRLDVLRRRAIQAQGEESLIQALADRAVARRQRSDRGAAPLAPRSGGQPAGRLPGQSGTGGHPGRPGCPGPAEPGHGGGAAAVPRSCP